MTDQTAAPEQKPTIVSEFHWRDGLYFARLSDGSVRLRKEDSLTEQGFGEWFRWVIPASEWASIVASVSANGDNATTFNRAEALHAGKLG